MPTLRFDLDPKGKCIIPDQDDMDISKPPDTEHDIDIVNNTGQKLRFHFVVSKAETKDGVSIPAGDIDVLKSPAIVAGPHGKLTIKDKMGMNSRGLVHGELYVNGGCPHEHVSRGHTDWHIDC